MKRSTTKRSNKPGLLASAAILALTTAACELDDVANPCGPEGPVPGTTCVGEMRTSTGDDRTYRLHFPPNYDPKVPLPVVMNLPGLDQASEVHEWGSGMSDFADEEGFIVVYPDSLRMWYTAQLSDRDVIFLSELADELTDRFAVDDRRIYITGISNGGAMAASMACERADQFAAFAPVAPVIGIEARHYACEPARPAPLQFIFGEHDNFVDWPEPLALAGRWALRNGADTDPELTTGYNLDEYAYIHPTDPSGDVLLYLAHRMSHTWPSRSGEGFDGNAMVWDFLRQHSLP